MALLTTAQFTGADALAQIFQEPLTVVVRLRAQRQSAQGAEVFREQFRKLLGSAAQQAKANGIYSTEDVRRATFAVVGFLDESVLNSSLPVFRDWARKPLQEELFGTHMAGELFFTYLQELLAQPDAATTADVLEIYCLCLLLGFRGRYSRGGDGDLKSLQSAAADKVRRIRGGRPALLPEWSPSVERLPERKDPWIRRLAWTASILAVLTGVSFGVYKFTLNGSVEQIQQSWAQAPRGNP